MTTNITPTIQRLLFLALCGLLFVVSCAEDAADEVGLVETAVILSTNTNTPPPTITATATITPTPTPTATLEPTSATSMPTPTLSDAESRLMQIEQTVAQGGTFQIVAPTAEEIAQIAFYSEFTFPRNTIQANNNYYALHSAFSSIIDQDIQLNFPDGYPNAYEVMSTFLVDPQIPFSQYGAYLPSVALQTFFEDGVANYFENTPQDLADGVTQELRGWAFTPHLIEIDGDDGNEWLIQYQIHKYNFEAFVVVDALQNGRFQQLHAPISGDWIIPSTHYQFDSDNDFTGDGIPDLAISSELYPGGNATTRANIDVYSWNGSTLSLTQHIHTSYYDFPNKPEQRIEDITGDGFTDIEIRTPVQKRFGCNWVNVDIYSWSNGLVNHTLSDGTPPNIFNCNLWQGLDNLLLALFRFDSINYNPVESTIFLERALSQSQTDGAITADVSAYTQTQLAFNYVAQGRVEEAQQLLAGLSHYTGQSTLAQIETDLFIESGQDPFEFCRKLLENGRVLLETDIGLYIDRGSYNRDPGYYGLPVLSYVCPLAQMAYGRLQTLTLTTASSPADQLAGVGISYAFAQRINMDNDSEPEWIGIIEPKDPHLVMFDGVNGRWQPHYFESPIYPIKDIEIDMVDIVEDESPETVITFTEDHSGSPYSESPTGYSAAIIEFTENEYQFLATVRYDEEAILAKEFTPELFGLDLPTLPYWRYTAEGENFHSHLSALAQAIINQEQEDAVGTINDLLAYLPQNSDEAIFEKEALNFLLGYQYELAGEEDTAVSHYLTLIQTAPNSPWSWLAWARLEPEE